MQALRWWPRLRALLGRNAWRNTPRPIPDALWHSTWASYPFLTALPSTEQAQLRLLCSHFLSQKEFHGTHGLPITDSMALAIAMQACLPLLHWGPPAKALAWYEDFVGIVVHADEVVAQREMVDSAGVVHHYAEVLSGETMERGPIMLNWHDVAHAGTTAHAGYNLVIHEFMHAIDMRDGTADGCPPLPPGFAGSHSARAARQAWLAVLESAYEAFREQTIIAERFGGAAPWLDAYGAESISEFFAVACEAYFVNRPRFAQEFAGLLPLLDAFFRNHPFTPALLQSAAEPAQTPPQAVPPKSNAGH